MKLQFIGTGDSESMDHYNTNLLVESEGRRMLVDCGWTAKQALLDIGLSIADIDAIFITHVHGDHVFGLERFGFECRYVHGGIKQKLFVPEVIIPILWDECLKGSMGYSSSGENTLNDFFDVVPVKDSFSWMGETYYLFPTPHTKGKPSFGIHSKGKFLFTSDSNVIPDLEELSEGTSLIFHDGCTDSQINPSHATIDEMLKAYSPEFIKRIHISHYGDNVKKHIHRMNGFAGYVKRNKVFFC